MPGTAPCSAHLASDASHISRALADAASADTTAPGDSTIRDKKIQKEYNDKRKAAGEAAFALQKKQQANLAAAKEKQAAKEAAAQADYLAKRAAWQSRADANAAKS